MPIFWVESASFRKLQPGAQMGVLSPPIAIMARGIYPEKWAARKRAITLDFGRCLFAILAGPM